MTRFNRIYKAVRNDLNRINPLVNLHSLDSKIDELKSTIEGAEFSINDFYEVGRNITKESVDLAKNCLIETGRAIKEIASSGDTIGLARDYLETLRGMCNKASIIQSRYNFSQTQGYKL